MQSLVSRKERVPLLSPNLNEDAKNHAAYSHSKKGEPPTMYFSEAHVKYLACY